MARKKRQNNKGSRRKALGILLFLLSLLILVSLVTHHSLDDSRLTGEVDKHLNPFKIQYHNQAGMLGVILAFYLLSSIGWLAFFVPIGFLLLSMRLFSSEVSSRFELNSFLLFVISLVGTMMYNVSILTARSLDPERATAGGFLSDRLTFISVKLLGGLGSYIVLGGVVLILLVLYTSVTPLLSLKVPLPGRDRLQRLYGHLTGAARIIFSFNWLPRIFENSEQDDESVSDDYGEQITDRDSEDVELAADEEEQPDAQDSKEPVKRKPRPKALRPAEQLQLKSLDYQYPGLEFLADNPESGDPTSQEELEMTARMLAETLDTFGVGIEGSIEIYPGPVITRFEFKPASGIKVNQILNLSDDLALALKAQRIRIIAPIPGKAAVGIEIPNRSPQMVLMKEILGSDSFKRSGIRLPLALGKTTSGKPYVVDLARLPHLLIAGATGAGKSVCMNVIITSMLYRLHPHQVRFIMVDPKMLELSVYSGIPHLGRPVVTNPRRAEKVFSDAVLEMEERYRKLAAVSVRNIEDYNAKQTVEEQRLPYIVILVDELADLMMSTTSSKTELLITRLAQMARAVGIHLVLATQRPSVDVITGLIKANFPARIAFQVSSKVDSRTIIDANGAEKLLGAGDMLFLAAGQPEPMRIHGAYISNDETDRIVSFINDQGLEMMALSSISQATGEVSEAEIDFGDPLFKEACEVVVRQKQGSVSLLQRRLGIGYQRAARLIDKLEQARIVSPFDGSKAREVLVDEVYLQTIFASAPVSTADSSSN